MIPGPRQAWQYEASRHGGVNSLGAIELAPVPAGVLRDFLEILFSRKWFVLLFFVVASGTAVIVNTVLTRPVYQARAQLLIAPDREEVARLTMPPSPTGRTFSYDEQTARAVELLSGRFLAERVVRTIGPLTLYPRLTDPPFPLLERFIAHTTDSPQVIFEKAVQKFLENVDAQPAGKSSIVGVSFKHENPEMAAKAVNALCEAYVGRTLSLQKNPRTDAFFQGQFDILRGKLSESEAKLAAVKSAHRITSSVKDEQELALKEQMALRTALAETRSKEAEAASRMARLREQLAALELQESELSTRFTDRNPTLRNVRDQIAALRAKLAAVEDTKRYGTSATRDGSLYALLQQEVLRSEAEATALRARADAQAAKLSASERRLDELARGAAEIESLEQRVRDDRDSYRLYQTKYEESRISRAMDSERIASVRIIDSAVPPAEPLNGKQRVKLLLSIAFAALGGIVLALALHFVSGRVQTISDVERALHLPVLAAIPELPLKPN
jgi:uncharacterized protein involved in exopolysaccharide biosynthesis